MRWKTPKRNAELILYPNAVQRHDLHPMEIPERKKRNKKPSYQMLSLTAIL